MSLKSFENYQKAAAKTSASNIEVAGRYGFQAASERLIVLDVAKKLSLNGADHLLEIGCGPGNLLMPLSYLVEQAAGIDNETALARVCARGSDASALQLLSGNFLEMHLAGETFSKILVYSVIQYMDSLETAKRFVEKAIGLLQPGGIMMLGDLPNVDKKKRWAASFAGRQAAEAWSRSVTQAGVHPLSDLPVDSNLVTVNDHFVISMMAHGRALGVDTYLAAQPADLPFGNTREDLLFVKTL